MREGGREGGRREGGGVREEGRSEGGRELMLRASKACAPLATNAISHTRYAVVQLCLNDVVC